MIDNKALFLFLIFLKNSEKYRRFPFVFFLTKPSKKIKLVLIKRVHLPKKGKIAKFIDPYLIKNATCRHDYRLTKTTCRKQTP
jgi:hypothetical protein